MRVILMVGLPGSGKSTWLKNQSVTAISSDEMRRLLTGDATDQSVNAQTFFLVRTILRLRLRSGQPVTYIDATNLTKKERQQHIRIAHQFGAEVDALWFDVPVEICKERNRQRERVVPDAAMDYLAGRLEAPTVEEGLSKVVKVVD